MTLIQIGLVLIFAGVDLIALAGLLGFLHRLFLPGNPDRPGWLLYVAGAGAFTAGAGLILSIGWLEAAAVRALAQIATGPGA